MFLLATSFPMVWQDSVAGDRHYSNPGDTITMQCKASSSASDYMSFYQFKPGQNPKLLLYRVSNHFEGTLGHFSGSGFGTNFSFTIRGVLPENEGEYYCRQYSSYPLTVIHFITKTTLSVIWIGGPRKGITPRASLTFMNPWSEEL
ncbi:hypothetical protein JRQ81_004688 [Phrynocephalus forsythii]|uniref:Ig-like domain-containing protein n=1 Tax=Phrynocephalus forsythii TaxID=171643 RepID=A0A9Q1AV89_9SAUR|nr:hypothetical protein JRQ81_004688 [Phrynocephalus forsythii]